MHIQQCFQVFYLLLHQDLFFWFRYYYFPLCTSVSGINVFSDVGNTPIRICRVFGNIDKVINVELDKEEKKVDPCEAKVKAFEKFVDELTAAQKNKAGGAKALKAYSDLLKQAPEQEAAVKECLGNEDFKTRLQNAMMQCKKIRAEK